MKKDNMRFKYIILFLVLVCFSIHILTCNRNKNNPFSVNEIYKTGDGLCIYNAQFNGKKTLPGFTINIDKATIIDMPIISYNNIISYDTTLHILKLTYSRDSLLNKIGQIGVYGKPFLVTLDSSKVYGGWFWTPISSIPCHWVVIEPNCVFDTLKTNEIIIKLGYPNKNEFIGKDPRNNIKIFSRLIKDGKVNTNNRLTNKSCTRP